MLLKLSLTFLARLVVRIILEYTEHHEVESCHEAESLIK